ncbi:MAG: hypothetical protein RDU89_10000 [bacterium]|nr:hypothetical protein [bacterium]
MLYVLDSVNCQVHCLNPRGELARTIELPFAGYPLDLVRTPEAFYVLDDSNQVFKVSPDGRLLEEYLLPEGMCSYQVYRLVAEGDRVRLWVQNYHEFDLDELPSSVDLDAFMNENKQVGPGITSPDGTRWVAQFAGLTEGWLVNLDTGKTIRIEANGLFGSARLVGFDGKGHVYLVVEDLYDEEAGLGVEVTLRKYAPDGTLAGVAVMPSDLAFVPRRLAEVTPDGEIFVMVPRLAEVEVHRLTPGSQSASGASRPVLDSAGGLSQKPESGESTIQSDWMPRYQVYNRAVEMTTVSWTWYGSYNWFNREWFADNEARSGR